MAFSPQQHTSLLRDGLDFVPESDFRYLPINVRLKLVELEKTNGQVYLPKNEAASLKREVAAEKMSEVAKRNDPDAYFGGDPEYSSTPITDDPAELKGRLGTDEYGTRPTIYRAIEPEGAVFNNRYLTSGQYESQYKESDPTIYGRYTPTKKGDEILLPPTASWLNPFADRINETEPHEYMHRGMMPTNWLSKYLLGPIDSISEKIGVGNLFGTRVFAGNQHTYIAKALAEDKQKKQMADFERQTSKLSERELATLKKYLESERNKLQLEKNRINKATGGEANNLQAALDLLKNPVPNIIKAPEEKETPKLIGEGGILFDYTDPVDVGLTALGFTGVGTAAALSIKAARLAAKLKKLETFKKLPLYHGGFLPSKNALKIKGVDVFYASPSFRIAERYNPARQSKGERSTKYKTTNRQPGVFEMQPPNKFAILDKPDKIFKKDIKDYLGDLKSQQKQIIKDNKENAIQKYGDRPNFNPENINHLPKNKFDDFRALDFQVKDLTTYLKNPSKYNTTQSIGYRYHGYSGILDVLKAKNYDAVLTNKAFTRLSSPKKSNLEKIRDADLVSDQVVFLKPMGAKQVSTKPLRKEFEDFTTDQYLNDFIKNKYIIKKATGGEVTNLQAALNMLQNPVTSSISPLGDPTLSPLMESLQKNPIDDFAMMMADPTKVGLKVINTPIKMQFKKLFAARGKFQQLVDKQKFKYDRGLDLASKADPKDIAQGTLQAHVALKSGKRFQRQLNDVEEKIRKLYKNK
jgi:hypothetical protein